MKLLALGPRPPMSASPSGRPTVVLLERDPYLAFLLRLHAPEADVVEAETAAAVDDVLAYHPDLVVAGVETAPFPLASLLDAAEPPAVVAVVDGARASRSAIPQGVDGVLARPFAPAELARAVRSSLRLPPMREEPRITGPALGRARAVIAPARIGALALAAVLEVGGGDVSRARSYILALAFAYAAFRWAVRRTSIVADTADVALALTLLVTTGGLSSNHLAFAIVAVAGAGLNNGPRWGLLAGSAIVAGSIPMMFRALTEGSQAREVIAWASLLPMVGLTGGFAARVWKRVETEGLGVLVEANRVLSSLYRIARTLPGGLEIGSVADATMHEIRDALGAPAGAVLLAEAGSVSVISSFGVDDPAGVIVRDPSEGLGAAMFGERAVLTADELHPATRQALGEYPCWLTAPMRREGIAIGMLVAACPRDDHHEPNLMLLRRLADEAAVAVENARLFSRVREISIDDERRRLARELHDGIAQSLTHVRYELDFVARQGAAPASVRDDLQRLSRVVDRTAGEVRSMILGLRAAVRGDGLVGALRTYLDELKRFDGPDLSLEAHGTAEMPPEVESEIFRVAQEAVSNALKHAEATAITVRLEIADASVRLVVEDDGVGLRSGPSEAGGGVGMEAMQERAELIGAKLDVGPGEPTGTRVTLMYEIGGQR